MYASAGRVEQRMSGGVRPNGVEFGLERGGRGAVVRRRAMARQVKVSGRCRLIWREEFQAHLVSLDWRGGVEVEEFRSQGMKSCGGQDA